jgi:hypothetical protein
MIGPKPRGYILTDADINNINVKRLKCVLAIVPYCETKENFDTYRKEELVEVSPKIIKILVAELEDDLRKAEDFARKAKKFLIVKAKKK